MFAATLNMPARSPCRSTSSLLYKAYGVSCQLADEERDPTELSLAENIVRVAMHPADQFEAFRDLVDGGASISDVAVRFGVSEALITKRLKLGRLSPTVLQAYRDGDITLEAAQAFAVSDDQSAQEQVLAGLSGRRGPQAIRSALTEGEIPATDKRLRLIGLGAYEQAGGPVRRDLFDPDNGGYAQDAALLDRLVAERLESVAAELRSEGWKWVDVRPAFDYADRAAFGRVRPQRDELSEPAQAALEQLEAAYDELADELENDPENADLSEQLDQTEAAIDEINAQRYNFPAEALAQAGAVVSVAWDGSIDVDRGLVHPDDVRAAKREARAQESGSNEGVVIPAKLTEELTAHRSAALAAELSSKPDTAIAVLVHALALPVFYPASLEKSCLQISADAPSLERLVADPGALTGLSRLDAAHAKWAEILPDDPADLWQWCFDQYGLIPDLLAFLVARSIDAIQRKAGRADAPHLLHSQQLATVLGIDMGAFFVPRADNFFGRLNRQSILSAITEAQGHAPAPSAAKMKKGELAVLAERQVSGTGWLPQPLRGPALDEQAPS